MPTIVISGPANAFAKNPRATDPITDRKTLARFHGLASKQACADTFDEPPLSELGISGGRLRFILEEDSPGLRITTAFHVPRRLTEEELKLLVDATKAQWSDGSGSGSFSSYYWGKVLSTSLAMALLNSDSSRRDIGEYFVDAYPLFADDGETRVKFLETDGVEKTDLDYLQDTARWGDPHAMLYLGYRYAEGEGVDQDHAKAFEWHMKSAEAGLPWGMGSVGNASETGNGVAMDLGIAAAWYRRGADQGYAPCQAELGECFERGKGVEVNLAEALRWYEIALKNGLPAVQPAIDRVKQAMS